MGSTKLCSLCGDWKLHTDFYADKQNNDGLKTMCKACYRAKYIPPGKQRYNKYVKEKRLTSHSRTWLGQLKHNAKVAGLPFNLTVDDLVVPTHCPVLGIPLATGDRAVTGANNTPTVDRIVPELGYTRGNVCIISRRANRLKQDSSLAELERLVAYVRRSINTADKG